ncbi:hypothetical protein GMORB2_6620 [Geosmithia morbida]|uniref:Acyl-CoA thioesterase n=1 Tax=Geosmithia morbida TaxID=1094350 RepID=A0A9P4YV36_9HYPO|nr:uncharacterized protein GMORB2_6620 [Geosmithia morbida]KAF4123072.1 hypothetical protein GMORB2_6620 [Geosmithia morbida]
MSLAELTAVERVGKDEYVSKSYPIWVGNAMPIAYGGCAMGVALRSACDTVPSGFTPYSVLGHFLGPASTDQKFRCRVHDRRTTRTFATRRVEVSQLRGDGTSRSCLELTADFHVAEASISDYQAAPFAAWPGRHDCPTTQELLESVRARGAASDDLIDAVLAVGGGGSGGQTVVRRPCPNGVAAQNLIGVAKQLPTTQDHLPITSKASADWQRCPVSLDGPAANFAAAIFLMDSALSFTPLTHDHKWFDDVAACSTLDFAFRIFVPRIDLEQWTLQERQTIRGGWGRSYTEGRLRDEKGQLLASMTQQSILRPHKGQGVKPKI